MAEAVSILINSLKEEINAMKNLLNLLEQQHNFLVAQDVFNLDSITRKIEVSCRDIAKVEVSRKSMLKGLTIKEAIARSKSKEASDYYEELVKLVDGCRFQKDFNDTLIKQSLSYTNSMLMMLKPKGEAKTYNGYGSVRR